MLHVWCSIDMLLRVFFFSPFVGFECSLDWNLLLKGLDDCVFKTRKQRKFLNSFWCSVCVFGIAETRTKKKKIKLSFWVSRWVWVCKENKWNGLCVIFLALGFSKCRCLNASRTLKLGFYRDSKTTLIQSLCIIEIEFHLKMDSISAEFKRLIRD